MKRLLFALVLLTSCAWGQVTVTGNLKTVLAGNLARNAKIRIRLENTGGAVPRVLSTGAIAQLQKDVLPDSNGAISTTVYSNADITPAGTFYCIDFISDNSSRALCYTITGASFNFNTATPLSLPVITPPFGSLGRSYTHTQASAATTWTITHNFASFDVVVECYNTSNQRIFPDLVTKTSSNVVTVLFVIAQAGSCTVMNATNLTIASGLTSVVLTNSTSPQSITGGQSLTVSGNFEASLVCESTTGGRVRDARCFAGADAKAKIQAAHDDLPSTGGIVDARGLEGAQTLSSQLAITKPMTLLLGAATYTCTSGVGANACIKATAPVSIVGMQSARDTSGNVNNGTTILAGSGFTNYLLEVSNTTHWSKAQNSLIQGVLLNGNTRTADCVRISNQFGVILRDVLCHEPKKGIVEDNTDSLWTEGIQFQNVWIYDPGEIGLELVRTGTGTVSHENRRWDTLNINVFQNNAIGIQVKPASVTLPVDMGNSVLSQTKIWFGSTTTNAIGMKWRGDGTATLFQGFYCEGTGGSGNVCWDGTVPISTVSRTSNVVTVTTSSAHDFATGHDVTIRGVTDTSFDGKFTITVTGSTTFTYAQVAGDASSSAGTAGTNAPMFEAIRYGGTGFAATPLDLAGGNWGATAQAFGIYNAYRIVGHDGNEPTRPAFSFLGDEDTGAYHCDIDSWCWSVNGTRRGFINSSLWVFEPSGAEAARVDSSGITIASGKVLQIGADPAEAGAIRLENAAQIVAEASPAGTDVVLIDSDSSERVRLGVTGASVVEIGAAPLKYRDVQTLAASTTPSVAGGNAFATANTASITNFTGGFNGQVIVLLCGADTTTSLTDASPLFLNGTGAFTCTADDTITLINNGSNWYEIGRSVN